MNAFQSVLTTFACSYHSKYCGWGPDPVPDGWEGGMGSAGYIRDYWRIAPLIRAVFTVILTVWFARRRIRTGKPSFTAGAVLIGIVLVIVLILTLTGLMQFI
jgi:hypothetical protein